MSSEATTAHPYSQRANLELGAHETGFLLGWIPATVTNDAAEDKTAPASIGGVFYLKTNDGHDRSDLRASCYREVVASIICLTFGLFWGELADDAAPTTRHGPSGPRAPSSTPRSGGGPQPGDPHRRGGRVSTWRPWSPARAGPPLRPRDGLDAVYVDLPLHHIQPRRPRRRAARAGGARLRRGLPEQPGWTATCCASSACTRWRCRRGRDRHRVPHHGRDLLAYVVADLPRG